MYKEFCVKRMMYLAMALASLGVDVVLASFGGLAFCPLLEILPLFNLYFKVFVNFLMFIHTVDIGYCDYPGTRAK